MVVAVPLELLVAVCAMVLLLAWVSGRGPEGSLLLHPVSLAVAIGLGWTLVTAMTSVDPLVSLKYALVRAAYIVTFFVGGLAVFSNGVVGARRVAVAGLAGFLPVVGWTVWRHAPSGFAYKTSVEVGAPFYPNHLEYGATLVFWMLVLLGLAVAHRVRTGRVGMGALILALGFLPVLWAAHSRSAWLALIAGVGGIVLNFLGVGYRRIVVIFGLAFSVFFGLFAGYFVWEGPNDQVSRFEEASFNERLNRWSCAVRMAEERPLVGFGPGTYEGSYGVFQDHREMTTHSSLKGSRGDAHSEFFSGLAEQGVVGFLMVAVLFGMAIGTGLKAVDNVKDEAQRWLALGWTASVVSLAVGNLFNSFFEVDRVAPLLWLACAAVVVMERECVSTRSEIH